MSTDTRQRNDELHQRIAKGDKKARDQLIELNLPLATMKVDDYLACFPRLEYLRDDLIGDGQLALVDAANRLQSAGKVKDATSYLRVAIQKAIGNVIDTELYGKDRDARRQPDDASYNRQQLAKVCNSDHVIGELEHDPRKEADLLELIVGCCESDEERAIVDLRRKGYVDAEIAKTLDIPLTTTYMLRRELYQRVLATGEILPD